MEAVGRTQGRVAEAGIVHTLHTAAGGMAVQQGRECRAVELVQVVAPQVVVWRHHMTGMVGKPFVPQHHERMVWYYHSTQMSVLP